MGKADIPLIFPCTLIGTSCIKIDGDGGGRITFSIEEEDGESLKALIDRRHVNLAFTVERERSTAEPVRFEASITGTSCIKIDGDMGGRVTCTVTDRYKPALKALIDYRMVGLVVTVEAGG